MAELSLLRANHGAFTNLGAQSSFSRHNHDHETVVDVRVITTKSHGAIKIGGKPRFISCHNHGHETAVDSLNDNTCGVHDDICLI